MNSELIAGFDDDFLTAVQIELDRQGATWGAQHHSLCYWLGILIEEVGEVSQAIIENRQREHIQKELVHTAAVCVRIANAISLGATANEGTVQP